MNKGNIPVEPEYLFKRLLKGIRAEKLDPLGAREWTGSVKRTLRAIAHEIDPEIDCCPNDTTPEFLIDFFWFKRTRMEDEFSNGKILLAVESEWHGLDKAWEDFSKLLYIRSPRKMLICSLSEKALDEAAQWFKQDLADIGGVEPNEKYILVNFGDEHAEYRWCDASKPIRFQCGPRERW